MAGQAGLTVLSAGSVLLLGGTEWTVAAVEPQHGRVLLSADGEERWRSIRWLVHHPDCRAVPDGAAEPEPAIPIGQAPGLDDLTGRQRELVRLRVAHLLETETGFRGRDPLRPEPGEPRRLMVTPHSVRQHSMCPVAQATPGASARLTSTSKTRTSNKPASKSRIASWQMRHPPTTDHIRQLGITVTPLRI